MNTPKLPPLPEREAFETWMQGDATLSLEKDGHGYVDMTAELMWHAWKARAAIQAQGVPDDEGDLLTIAYLDGFAKGKDSASAPPAPQAESPCACWPGRMCSRSAQCASDLKQASVVQQEPRFTIDQIHQSLLDHGLMSDTEREDILASLGNARVADYTNHAQQAKPQPLKQSRIDDLFEHYKQTRIDGLDAPKAAFTLGVMAAEAAHGIVKAQP